MRSRSPGFSAEVLQQWREFHAGTNDEFQTSSDGWHQPSSARLWLVLSSYVQDVKLGARMSSTFSWTKSGRGICAPLC